MNYQVTIAEAFTANIRKQPMKLDLPANLPEQSIRKIFEYGLQRILNDASASAKTPAEALELAGKRWDSLVAGQIRQSAVRTGDPIAREAMRLAIAKVQASPKVKAWQATNGLKVTDKEYTDKVRELAKAYAERDDILATAKANVELADSVEVDDDDINI